MNGISDYINKTHSSHSKKTTGSKNSWSFSVFQEVSYQQDVYNHRYNVYNKFISLGC